MTRKLHKLGIALLATLALSALAATAAGATQFHTKGAIYPAQVNGESLNEHTFKFHSGEVKCKKATFSGTLGAASSKLTVHPSYQECQGFGLVGVAVDTTGCDYIISSGAKTALDEYAATLDIECEATKFIKITSATCEVRISAQNGLTSMTLVDSTAAGNVLPEFNIGNFGYSITKDGFGCPLTGVENRVDGTYKGAAAKFTATAGGEPVGLTVE